MQRARLFMWMCSKQQGQLHHPVSSCCVCVWFGAWPWLSRSFTDTGRPPASRSPAIATDHNITQNVGFIFTSCSMRLCAGSTHLHSRKLAAACGIPLLRAGMQLHRPSTARSSVAENAVESAGGGAPEPAQPPVVAAAAAPAEAPVKEFTKRSVAMHIGYIGTAYYGLQANRELPHLGTIEGVLEKALLDAGMIKEVNFGDFRKTKWSRSSRTDKGVHSLSTVIGVRLVLKADAYESDPEGLAVARAINAHLPPDICVFSVQRTNKGFNTRRWCNKRSYEYYLPASALRLLTPDGSSPQDQEVIRVFREALAMYAGYIPYHNFAGNRKQYVQQRKKGQNRAAKRAAKLAAAAAAGADGAPGDAAAEGVTATEDGALPTPTAAAAEGSRLDTDSEEPDEGEEAADAEERALYEAAAAAAAAGGGGGEEQGVFLQTVRWLDAPDPSDPLVKSHYRRMWSFTAQDPVALVPGGVPCPQVGGDG